MVPEAAQWMEPSSRDDHDLCRHGCGRLLWLKHGSAGTSPPLSAFRQACGAGRSLEAIKVLIGLYNGGGSGRTKTLFAWAAADEAREAASRGDLGIVTLLADAGLAQWDHDIIERLFVSEDGEARDHANRLDAAEGHPVLKALLWQALERKDTALMDLLLPLAPDDLSRDVATAKALYECPAAGTVTGVFPGPSWVVIKFAWERFRCLPKTPDVECALWDAMATGDTAAVRFFDTLPPGSFDEIT